MYIFMGYINIRLLQFHYKVELLQFLKANTITRMIKDCLDTIKWLKGDKVAISQIPNKTPS